MRRIIILTLLALLPTLFATAQVGEQRHDFSIGVNGGMLLNKVAFTPKINQTYYMAPSYGVTLRYTSERYFGMICAFQAEINYSGMGWKEDIYSRNNEKLPDTYQRNLKYVQMPILAHLGFGQIDRGFKGFFIAGPQVSYLVADSEERSETWTTVAGAYPDRMNGIIAQYGLNVENKFEYGITAGLGCEFSTRAGHFLLDGRYYMGLSNLFNNSKTDPFPKSNNGYIMVKLSYLFDISH